MYTKLIFGLMAFWILLGAASSFAEDPFSEISLSQGVTQNNGNNSVNNASPGKFTGASTTPSTYNPVHYYTVPTNSNGQVRYVILNPNQGATINPYQSQTPSSVLTMDLLAQSPYVTNPVGVGQVSNSYNTNNYYMGGGFPNSLFVAQNEYNKAINTDEKKDLAVELADEDEEKETAAKGTEVKLKNTGSTDSKKTDESAGNAKYEGKVQPSIEKSETVEVVSGKAG